MRSLLIPQAFLVVLAGSLPGQTASDDFNRPDAGTPGPDWVVDDGLFAIESNQGKCNNPWSLGFMHHASLSGAYADSVQSVDFAINGFGGDSISLIAGLNPATWSAIETRLQDNDGDGLFDRLIYYSAVNAGTWDGSNLFFDLATPVASGTMTLSFSAGGDSADVEITGAGGTENFSGAGILTFTFPPTGSNLGIGGFGDSYFDNWTGSVGPLGPVYAITNLAAGQVATFEVTGLNAGDQVIMAYSRTGAGPTGTPYGTVDMSPPIMSLPTVVADPAGAASRTVSVPAGAAGASIWTQSLIANTGVLTNSLAETVL